LDILHTRFHIFLQTGDKRFPELAEVEANLSVHARVHITGMELNLNPLRDNAAHVPRFGIPNSGVLELDAMLQIESYSSNLNMEAQHSSKTVVTIYQTTGHHMPDDNNLHGTG
jgi:hypothetical protein